MKPKHIGYLKDNDYRLFLLFIDWFIALLNKNYGDLGNSSSQSVWSIKLHDNSECRVFRKGDSGSIMVEAPPAILEKVIRLAKEALDKTLAKETGGNTLWRTSFSSKTDLLGGFFLHMMRGLNEHKFYEGTWKLTNSVLLQFTQKQIPDVPISVDQEITVIISIPSPGQGPYGSLVANEILPKIRAITSFITGSHLRHLPFILPMKNEDEKMQAFAQLRNPSTPELPIGDVPLSQALAGIIVPDNTEAFDRVIGAMMAYEHGIMQSSESAAIIFFVTALESLSTPNTSWQNQRVTKRFHDFLMLACPDAIEEIRSHANFTQAFGNIGTSKRFIEELYNMRSKPVHTGRFKNPSSLEDLPNVRVMLISELTKKAIIAFLKKPFSPLTGNPEIDPLLQIPLSTDEKAKLKKAARSSKKSEVDWARILITRELSKHS